MRTPNYKCVVCGKMHYQRPGRIAEAKHGLCCSMKCGREFRSSWSRGSGNHQFGLRRELNSSFKSDKRMSTYGYRLVYRPDHHRANCDGFVFEHILVAEETLGREIRSGEVVHHKDGDKANNSADNLVVMEKGCHIALHNRERGQERDDRGRFTSGRKRGVA